MWSSYRAKVGLENSDTLDFDECYIGLKQPVLEYVNFVLAGVSEEEYEFIRKLVSRNQLTGSCRFIDQIEARCGVRIEARSQG